MAECCAALLLEGLQTQEGRAPPAGLGSVSQASVAGRVIGERFGWAACLGDISVFYSILQRARWFPDVPPECY